MLGGAHDRASLRTFLERVYLTRPTTERLWRTTARLCPLPATLRLPACSCTYVWKRGRRRQEVRVQKRKLMPFAALPLSKGYAATGPRDLAVRERDLMARELWRESYGATARRPCPNQRPEFLRVRQA